MDSVLQLKSMIEASSVSPDVIWCAVGCGSVDEAKGNFRSAVDLTVHLPHELCKTFPDSKLIFFSSDYVEDWVPQQRSLYAQAKQIMEDLMEIRDHACQKKNVRVIRVGSLYGRHRPERCLPGKLKAAHPEPCELTLPSNMVIPTPTAWLAKALIENVSEIFRGPLIQRFQPEGPAISVADWGREILGPKYTVWSGAFDERRPRHVNCSAWAPRAFPSWRDLWKEHAL